MKFRLREILQIHYLKLHILKTGSVIIYCKKKSLEELTIEQSNEGIRNEGRKSGRNNNERQNGLDSPREIRERN